MLSCEPAAAMDSLIDFSGSNLHVLGVQLQDCNITALRVSSDMDADVVIEDSVFQNFGRMLGPGRAKLESGALPAPWTSSTGGLVLHAGNFSGNLTVRNTLFLSNEFWIPGSAASARRRLHHAWGVRRHIPRLHTGESHHPRQQSQQQERSWKGLAEARDSISRQLDILRRRLMAAPVEQQAYPGLDPKNVWSAFMDGSFGTAADTARGEYAATAVSRRRTAMEAGLINPYIAPLLKQAKLIHPNVQTGPWADDAETVFSVICGRSKECRISFANSTFDANRGVATGALYVLCDGAASCDVSLADTNFTNNWVHWQESEQFDDPADEEAAPPPQESGFMSGGFSVPLGLQRLQRIAPWLTYLYPLLHYYKIKHDDPNNVARAIYGTAEDNALYPNITGRTLGAVVLQQRGSPAVGVAPSAVRPMMTVRLTGGTFSGNDGAAIMSTATDFMELAGGNGTWSGAPPRHSADFSMSGVHVDGHTSGWPAVWIRWARNVAISGFEVTNSSAGVWLDEVRDSALLEDSTFTANTPSNMWLEYLSFQRAIQSEQSGFDLGVETSHVVKIQMTPLGEVQNSVTVRRCLLKGNAAYNSGVLTIRGADIPEIDDPNNQPGRTRVVVQDSTFISNNCGWVEICDDAPFCVTRSPANCPTPARPLRISCVYDATVQNSRFLGNSIGGLDCRSVHNVVITDTEFDNNSLTFFEGNDILNDLSYGGGAVHAVELGTDSTGGMTIQATNFTGNTGSVGGGAVYMNYFGSLIITGCRFEGNTAETFDGGALWLDYSTSAGIIQWTNFTSNRAGRNGGAIAGRNVAPTISQGLLIDGCIFTDNEALLNPTELGRSIVDQAGGGAVFASGTSIIVKDCSFETNSVFGHAGGALRVVDSDSAQIESCLFTSNRAIMGGAVALTRLSSIAVFAKCIFRNNTAVDPWAWQTNQNAGGVPPLASIDPGYGGAIYTKVASVGFAAFVSFSDNTAKFGGAVAAMSSERLLIMDDVYSHLLPYFYTPMSAKVADAMVLSLPGKSKNLLPSRFLFASNTALIGGALYTYDIQEIRFTLTVGMKQWVVDPNNPSRPLLPPRETEESELFGDQQAILFIQNTANGGAATHLEGNGVVTLSGCRFVANRAVTPPLATNYSGLNGLEKDYGTAKALPCYNGGGGAICIVGQANTTISVDSSEMVANMAKDGAGMFIAEGLDCVQQTGCYTVKLDAVNMTANSATSRGGAVFWMHEGVLQIESCPTDQVFTLAAGIYTGTTLLASSATGAFSDLDARVSSQYITLRVPVRKGPAIWYQQMTREKQDILLSHVGGPERLSADAPLYASNGDIQLAGQVVLTTNYEETAATMQKSDSTTVAAPEAYFDTSSGTVTTQPGSSLADIDDPSGEQVPWAFVGALPLVLTESVLLDPSWLGVPYDNLPCANWKDNTADTGPDVASTPYFLMSPPRLDFYTSNTDIKVNITVHDWLGNLCTGNRDTQPIVLVQAQSSEISGGVTAAALNGTAVFNTLRLRAQQGLHKVSMTGQLQAPPRELLSSQLTINVRPCAINEFLSPKNLDECLPCDPSSFNLNVSEVTCQACPDNAKCDYPDPAACKLETDCDPVGYLVPDDGYWHSNFFSEEVIECTNSDACTSPKRTTFLSQLQLQIWEIARELQLNASNAFADVDSREVMAQLLSSAMARRLLQANKALQDDVYILLLLNATADLMPLYMQTQCTKGYKGNLCGECAEGYGWRQVATCGKCPPRALNNLYYALVTALTLSLLAFTVHSSLKEQRRPGGLAGKQSVAVALAADGTTADAPDREPGGLPKRASQFHDILASAEVEGTVAKAAAAIAVVREDISACNPQQPARPPAVDDPISLESTDPRPDHRADSTLGGDAALPGTTVIAVGSGPTAGPVAEGNLPMHDDALYNNSLAASSSGTATVSHAAASPNAVASMEIQPEERAQATSAGGEGAEAAYLRQQRPSVPSHPLAESKDYANMLYEEQGSTEARSTDGTRVGITAPTSPAGVTTPVQCVSESTATAQTAPASHPASASASVASSRAGDEPADDTTPATAPRNVLHLPIVMTEKVRGGQVPKAGAVVGRERAHQSTIVKIFVSYVQMIALLQNVPLDAPGVVDVYYRINNQAISYPGSLVSLDCSLPNTSISKAFTRVILTVLAPLYIFAGAVVWFLVFNTLDFYFITPWYVKNNRKRAPAMPAFREHLQTYMGRQLIVTFISIFFFFYPSVVQSLMTIFNCKNVNVQSSDSPLAIGLGLKSGRVWSQDYGTTCYKGAHLGLTLGLGVPGVILIAVGWPLMSGLFMIGKLTFMNNIRFTEEMTSFFLADFKARYAWWESAIMVRKLLIAVIVTLVDDTGAAGIQLLLVMCVLVIAAGIHVVSMPYHHSYTNYLELTSLGMLLATLYFSLYFQFSAAISGAGRIIISFIILMINIVMVAVFIYYIVQAYFYDALCTTGLSSLDSETRRKLTAAELQQWIYDNLTAKAGGKSFKKMSSNRRVASLYAAAVWASMRVESTTHKLLSRVRTLLREPEGGRRLSREGSASDFDDLPFSQSGSADGTTAQNGGGDDTEEDPEAAKGGSAAAAARRKRNMSSPGTGIAAATTTSMALQKYRSLPKYLQAGKKMASSGRLVNSQSLGCGPGNTFGSKHRNPSCSSPGDAPPTGGSGSPPASPIAVSLRECQVSSGGSRDDAPPAAARPPAAIPSLLVLPPTVSSRASSQASVDSPGVSHFPSDFDALGGMAAATTIVSPRSPANNVRSQSRLAVTSSLVDANGEVLPPPPTFLRHPPSPKGL